MTDISNTRIVQSGLTTTINLSASGNVLKAWNFKIADIGITASLPLKLDGNKQFTSGAINLSGGEVTGTLPEGSVGLAYTTSTLQGNILAEQTSRSNADTTLQNNINAEITARTNADTTLQAHIDSEATTRANADTTLQNNINAEITARTGADNAEITARSNADTTLQAHIDSEATSRANADTTLQNNINTEITARTNADTTLQAHIDSEATSRANADTTLQNNINTEITARTNADTTLQANIDAEVTARASGDSDLQGNLDSEATSRANADTTLQANIDSEATTRANADTTLQAHIDTEATARANADTTLQAHIDTEATARANADTTLQSHINTINGEGIASGNGIATSGTIGGNNLNVALGNLTGNWDAATGSHYISVTTPSSPAHAVTKAYVDQLVITGGTVKEAILSDHQLKNGAGVAGILAAEVVYFNTNPAVNDTIIVTDGTTTETYTFKAAHTVPFDVAIAVGDPVTTMNNLYAEITASSTAWISDWAVAGLDAINTVGVVIFIEKNAASGVSPSRIYGTWATQANCQVVAYNTAPEYRTSQAASNLPLVDPGAGRFGIRKAIADLVDGEIHDCLETDTLRSWHPDTWTWLTLSGSGSLPDATAASGGAIKGKVTFDSDLGLDVASGIARVKKDNTTIDFNGSGQLEVKGLGVGTSQLAATGVTAAKLGSDVAGNGLTGGNGSALAVLNNGTTIAVGASGIKVPTGGITDTELASNSVTNGKIAADAVTAGKIRLENATYLRARNAANNADINILEVDGSNNVVFASIPYTPAAAPDQNYEVANKKYVDDQILAYSPETLDFTAVAGEVLAANVTYVVRWALTGETAGRVYIATSDHVADPFKFLAIGVVQSTVPVNPGDTVAVIKFAKKLSLMSADNNFAASTDNGLPLFLNLDGEFSRSATAGISASAAYGLNIIGVQLSYNATVTSSTFSVDCSLNGVSVDLA